LKARRGTVEPFHIANAALFKIIDNPPNGGFFAACSVLFPWTTRKIKPD